MRRQDYGLGLEVVVVVVLLEFDEFGGGDVVVVLVFVVFVVSLVFSLTTAVEAGLTMVVLLLAGEEAGAGATVSVFCSQAPRSAALARMQISFFIVVDWLPILGLRLNRNGLSFRSCEN